jgi:hypothetical protein
MLVPSPKLRRNSTGPLPNHFRSNERCTNDNDTDASHHALLGTLPPPTPAQNPTAAVTNAALTARPTYAPARTVS